MIISKDLPAGNILVLKIQDNSALLDVEMRDSANDWFYWKFKAVFSKPGLFNFRFEHGFRVGTRGPAYSLDHGLSWHWLSETMYSDTQSFQWNCTKPCEVFFCQAIPYMQPEFDAFAKEFASKPFFQLSTLCKSRKGRDVELLTIREGSPECAVLLTARHHCQEMMANQVLEGALRSILADTPEAKEFRKHIAVYAIPFVDKDGAEDGDQGKGRKPFDHGRDYQASGSIYPECAAIRNLIDEIRPFFILDLHCPWIRGDFNETAYQVQNKNPEFTIEKERFGKLLECNSPACAPYARKHDIPWGVSWNGSWNAKGGVGLKSYGQTLPFVRYCQTIEIPFANFGEHTATRESMLLFGDAIAKSIRLYREELLSLAEQTNSSAEICFTGDIMCYPEQTEACSAGGRSNPDYTEIFRTVAPLLQKSDYAVGNLETVFAGEEAGYSTKLYSFNTPDVFAQALSDAGINLVSTANNHCLDRGIQGLKHTLEVLDKVGIAHTGTARTSEERDVVCLQEINGIRFAFLSYTYGTNAFANHEFLKAEEAYVVNLFQEQETLPGSVHLLNSFEKIAEDMKTADLANSRGLAILRSDIAEAKQYADYIIVLMHSGGQYNVVPDPYTEFLVKEICAAGADMIVGNHPHVIHMHRVQDGVPVFYSLGNFSFTPGASPESRKHPESAYSILLSAKFEKKDGKTSFVGMRAEVLKCVIGPDGIARTILVTEGTERDAAGFVLHDGGSLASFRLTL